MNIGRLIKTYWRLAVLALGVILLAIFLIPKRNNYKAPIRLMSQMANASTSEKMLDKTIDQLNGLGEDEVREIVEIMRKADDFDTILDMMMTSVDTMKENAGEKYKVKLTARGRDRVDRDERKDLEEELEGVAERFAEKAEALKEDSTYLEDQGLTQKDIKKLIKNYEKLAKTFQKARVSKGFDVLVKSKITGSLLDEPIKGEQTVRVYKISRRWVSEDALSTALFLVERF